MTKEVKEKVKETPKLTKEQEEVMLDNTKIESCLKEINPIPTKYGCGIRVKHTPELFVIKEQ